MLSTGRRGKRRARVYYILVANFHRLHVPPAQPCSRPTSLSLSHDVYVQSAPNWYIPSASTITFKNCWD